MSENIKLSELFADPPAVCSPGCFWLLNGKFDEETIRTSLRDLKDKGLHMVCPHPLPAAFRPQWGAKMEPDYLTEEYFRLFGVILDECRALGMYVMLYDEGGWPSGGACGKVLASDPERFTCKYLVLDGPGKVKVEYAKVNPNRAGYPDLLNPDVVKKFIELTHDEYYRRFPDSFGTVIKWVFTDEPGYMTSITGVRLSWCDDFAEEFMKRKNYDITPFLADILSGSQEIAAINARIDFHDVKSQLFVERYTIPLQQWCRERGVESTGHMNGEDEPVAMIQHNYGQIMRTLRTLDAPGVDLIWRQIWQDERLHTFPKFASSAARQIGRRSVLAEVFGVYGAGLTPEQMKFISAYLLLCGVNTFVYSGIPVFTGEKQMSGARPLTGRINPLWKYFREIYSWAHRFIALAANSEPVVENGLFMDTVSLFSFNRIAGYAAFNLEHIARRMLESQLDFDYVDEDILLESIWEGGVLKAGSALYKRFIIPAGARMSEKASAHLEKLKAQGAEIISSDDVFNVRPLLEFKERNPNIMLRTHQYGSGSRIYFMLNNSKLVQCVSCVLPSAPTVIADPESGNFSPLPECRNGVWYGEFAPGELKVLISGDETLSTGEVPARPGEVTACIDGVWQLRKIRQYSVGEDDYVVEDFADAPAIPCTLGDWAEFLGKDFSGDAEYSVEFDCNESEVDRFIDLGDAKYVASVTLNGVELGTRIAPPYCFDAAPALRQGKNHLQVHVVNTLANAISPVEILEKWKQLSRVSPYEQINRYYEQDSLASGLFGPVTLKKRA